MFREWLSDPSDLKVERPRKLQRLDGGAATVTLAGPPATVLASAPWPPVLLQLWVETMPAGDAPRPPSPGAGESIGEKQIDDCSTEPCYPWYTLAMNTTRLQHANSVSTLQLCLDDCFVIGLLHSILW